MCDICKSEDKIFLQVCESCAKNFFQGFDFKTGEVGGCLTCLRCGRKWFARVPRPIQCPSCKSIRWNVPQEKKEL